MISDPEVDVPDEPDPEVERITLVARGVVWGAVSTMSLAAYNMGHLPKSSGIQDSYPNHRYFERWPSSLCTRRCRHTRTRKPATEWMARTSSCRARPLLYMSLRKNC